MIDPVKKWGADSFDKLQQARAGSGAKRAHLVEQMKARNQRAADAVAEANAYYRRFEAIDIPRALSFAATLQLRRFDLELGESGKPNRPTLALVEAFLQGLLVKDSAIVLQWPTGQRDIAILHALAMHAALGSAAPQIRGSHRWSPAIPDFRTLLFPWRAGTGRDQRSWLIDRACILGPNAPHLTRRLVHESEHSPALRHLHETLGHLSRLSLRDHTQPHLAHPTLAELFPVFVADDAPRKARTAGTFQSISDAWEKSAAFARLAPRTKLDYLSAKAKIDAKWGTYPIEVIEDPKIRPRFLDWRDEMGTRSLRQADAVFGVLRIIIEWGRDRGLIALNHATRPKKLYRADRSEKLWLPEQLDAFRAVATPQMRLALELALWTGQRQGDLLRLGWSSYDGERLSLRQGKRRRKVDMPVPAPLKLLLDSAKRTALTILTAPNGKPWRTTPKPTHFQHHWRSATLAAGLDGLHFHDLRGTTCTLLAEAGATPSEIAAVLGWTVSTVNQMLDTYQAMTASLSDSAVAKLERKAR